ncbi:DUF1853 family protein [Marinobacter sediminum]|uniref:DUF1853 family protein n=1 Tax=Marinobacter sediminum TaxID=256323 RepID=UPI0019393D7D|nr:DUF1853 family protein [Marinobacter sediminum]
MTVRTPNNSLLEFRHPAVRHLAWLCSAPQLLFASASFQPADYLPADYPERLLAWDQNLDTAPALLREPPQRRLGFYFERLYEVMLTDLLGWPILLKNAQIQSNGHTLGELDFVVHNTTENRIEHHEIAIKYYLGVPNGNDTALWYGPNARDRLDLKSDRLINHQSTRTHQPETQALLSDHGITGPLTARIFMPGYLFYPLSDYLEPPAETPTNHLRGWWTYANDLTTTDTSSWVQLHKPHWVGPWRQFETPEADSTEHSLTLIKHDQIPRLYAELWFDQPTNSWCEKRRIFVAPAEWPI